MTMKWLTQFSLIMRSNLTTLKDKIEDPEKTLHQLLIDMEEELDSVRSRVAEAVADEIQMRQRTERERADVAKWSDRAAQALKRLRNGPEISSCGSRTRESSD
jgi:phage shock protein A